MVAVLFLTVGLTSLAGASEYALHGRISAGSDGTMVRGAADESWSYIALNTLVLSEDDLWTEDGNPVEVEFPDGNFLRLGGGSKASIANIGNGIVVNGMAGSFYVQRIRRSSNTFTFGTPSCTVEVSPDSMVRVDITPEGSATVSVRWGRVKVAAGNGNPILVSTGRQVMVDPGYLPSAPYSFSLSAEDSFDAWNRERGQLLAGSDAAYVTTTGSNPVGTYDLQTYGDFFFDGGVRYWRPTVVVDYVPYRHGHWSYVRGIGHTWVGEYPFCYVTSHYGRWSRHPRYGWVWSYRDAWAPAWAATVRSGDYFVWAPLGMDDRPVTYGSLHFAAGGVNFSLTYSSYCRADDMYLGPSYVLPCQPAVVQNVTNITIWNIYGDSNHTNRPTRHPVWTGVPDSSSMTVRDYAPQRSIRGRQDKDRGHVSAPVRGAELDRSFEGYRNRQIPTPGSRAVRTSSSDLRRSVPKTQAVRATDPNRTTRESRPLVTAPREVQAETARKGSATTPQIRTDRAPMTRQPASTRSVTPTVTEPQRVVRERSSVPTRSDTPAVSEPQRIVREPLTRRTAPTQNDTPTVTQPRVNVREPLVRRPAQVQTTPRQQVQQPVVQSPAIRQPVTQPRVQAPEPVRQVQPAPRPAPQIRVPQVSEVPIEMRQGTQNNQQPRVSQPNPVALPQVRNIQPSTIEPARVRNVQPGASSPTVRENSAPRSVRGR